MRLFILFFSLIMVNCASKKDFLQDNKLEIRQNEVSNINNDYGFQLKEIISDSRCPSEVTCIWAGQVELRIAVFKANIMVEEKVLIVDYKSLAENKLFFEKYLSQSEKKLKHIAVSPSVQSDKQIKNSDYVLKLFFKN